MILQVIFFLLIAVAAAGFRTVYALQGKLWLVLNDKASAVSARALHFVDDRLSRIYTACRLGTSVFFIGAAWFLGLFFLDSAPWSVVVYILCLWAGLMLVREILPKLFLLSPKKSLQILVIPVIGLYYLFYPFIWIKEKLLRLTTGQSSLPVRSAELPTEANTVMAILDEEMIDEESGVNAELLENALEFKSVRVKDCMVPRTEITAVEKETDIKDLRRLFTESGHSKIFVFDKSIDNIVGYCRVGDLFRKPEDIGEILVPVLHVSQSMPAKELMLKLSEEHKSMAVVSDEYGGTAGIISMEDIVEEIFGEIDDEHDEEADKFTEEVLPDGSYVFSADIPVEYLNKKYHFEIPKGNYDSLGGYIIAVHEDIPSEGEELRIDKFRCFVLSMEGTRINQVKIYIHN